MHFIFSLFFYIKKTSTLHATLMFLIYLSYNDVLRHPVIHINTSIGIKSKHEGCNYRTSAIESPNTLLILETRCNYVLNNILEIKLLLAGLLIVLDAGDNYPATG